MSFDSELLGLIRTAVREVVREEMGARPTELENELLTYEQAARSVTVSPSTIKRWVKTGQLRAIGKGKLRRVRLTDVKKCFEGEKPVEVSDVKSKVTSILATLPGRR